MNWTRTGIGIMFLFGAGLLAANFAWPDRSAMYQQQNQFVGAGMKGGSKYA